MKIFKTGVLCTFVALAFSGTAKASACSDSSVVRPLLSGEPITLDLAIQQVRSTSPSVRQAALEAIAREAETDQASQRINPTFNFEIENFSGSGGYSGFDQTEYTYTFEQTFELGRKRSKRKATASANEALGVAECELVLRETELQATLRFYDLVAAQELADLAQQSAQLTDSFVETVSKRVEAGAAAPPELNRARAEAAKLRAYAITANAEVENRKYELAALWGSDNPQFSYAVASGNLNYDAGLTKESLSSHPNLKVAESLNALRLSQRDLARANVFPDLSLSAGIRQFNDTNDQAFILGISIPLPIFDRNQNGIKASSIRSEASQLEIADTEASLRAQINIASQKVQAAQTRLDVLEAEAVPAALSAYEASAAGYAAGRFDLTTTLAARQSLIDVQVAVILARQNLNKAKMQLGSLLGTPPFQENLK